MKIWYSKRYIYSNKRINEQLCLKGFPNQYDDLDSFPTVIGISDFNSSDTIEKNVDSSKTIDCNIYTNIYTKENKESKSYSFFIDDEIA